MTVDAVGFELRHELQSSSRGPQAGRLRELTLRLVEEYLGQHRSDATRRGYRIDLAAWFRFLADRGVQPLDASRADVEAWVSAMGEPGQHGRSPRTIGRRLSAVSGLYEYALDEQVVDRNPVSRVRRPVVDDEVDLGLTVAQVHALLAAAGEHRVRAARARAVALVTVLLFTGLRLGELLAVDADQVDSERGHTVLRDVRRKGGKIRTVLLVPAAAAALEAYLGDRATGPLLATSTGARWDDREARRVWVSAATRADLPVRLRHPHVARHTYATLALDAGETLQSVQDALDHADPRTTRRYDRRRAVVSEAHPSYRLAGHLGRA